MSRAGEGDGEESFPNEWAFWERRTRQVLNGRPGRKALVELREALLALPEKRLISRALSTAGKVPTMTPSDDATLLAEEGEGVCAVGAFVWHQRVKSGEDARAAMVSLPLNPDHDGESRITIQAGTRAGLTETLAWVLMATNDDDFGSLTPEQRYKAFLRWIDAKLAVA